MWRTSDGTIKLTIVEKRSLRQRSLAPHPRRPVSQLDHRHSPVRRLRDLGGAAPRLRRSRPGCGNVLGRGVDHIILGVLDRPFECSAGAQQIALLVGRSPDVRAVRRTDTPPVNRPTKEEHHEQGQRRARYQLLRGVQPRDFDAYDDMFADDVAFESVGGVSGTGVETVKFFDNIWVNAASDWNIEGIYHLRDGDRVVCHNRASGIHDGTLLLPDESEVPATGNKVDAKYFASFEVRDGKIVSELIYFDRIILVEQLRLDLAASA